MNAYDKDIASSDKLGSMLPLSFVPMVADDKEQNYDVDLFLDYKKTGNVKFSTKFIWMKPDPPPNPKLNANCRMNVVIKSGVFLKDADTFGKQDPYA